MSLACELLSPPAKDDQLGSPLQAVDPEPRAVVDPHLRRACPNGLYVTRISADEALDTDQKLRPGSQITKTSKPSDEPLCLAVFNHPPTVAPRLRSRNAALPAPIKDNTSFERCP